MRTEFETNKTSISTSKMIKEIIKTDIDIRQDEELKKAIPFFDVSVNETKMVLMQISGIFQSLPGLFDMGIYILNNKTKRDFLFSDSPVVFYNKAYQHIKHQGTIGLQSPGLVIFFPISKYKCLMLIDEEKYTGDIIRNNFYDIHNEFDINNINKLQLHHSLNSIYFSDDNEEKYIHKLWKQERKKLSNQFSGFYTATEVNKKNSKLMVMYQKQIPYNLNLSFINPKSSNSKKIEHYRSKELIEILREDWEQKKIITNQGS